MILFYNKIDGSITGTIEGRIHNPIQLGMWIGKKEETQRIVVNWIPVRWYNKNGMEIKKDDPEVYTSDFEPDTIQKDIFIDLDKNLTHVFDYFVKDGLLVKK